MALGFACVFLLTIVALLLRFGIPRATPEVLASTKWFVAVLSAMFAFLVLFALAAMGAAARWRDAAAVESVADVGSIELTRAVIVRGHVARAMPDRGNGRALVRSVDTSLSKATEVELDLSDGPLKLRGDEYEAHGWPFDDAAGSFFLERGEPVTVLGSVVDAGVIRAEQVFAGDHAERIRKKAKIDFFIHLVTAIAATGSVPGVPLLLFFAVRRRRRDLASGR